MTDAHREPTIVLAAVIEREGRFLVTRRLRGSHLAGLWEFPGGKCEPGETHAVCLAREILEELGVPAIVGGELIVSEHRYPDRVVRLHFRACSITGEARAMLGQEMRWVGRADLRTLEFPAADKDLIDLMTRDA